MKRCTRRIFLLLVLAASPFVTAAQLLPGLSDPAEMQIRSNRYWEISSRLESAVEHRDFAAIRGLYQTNGVTSDELETEISRWRQLLDLHPGKRVSPYFKELDSLPSQARESWTQTARQLTDRKVTHVVSLFFPPSNVARLVLPMVLDDGRLRLVASEKRNAQRLNARRIQHPRQPVVDLIQF
jgi:hypothetical protein